MPSISTIAGDMKSEQAAYILRDELISRALKEWKGKLIDTSRRNPLLYYRTPKSSVAFEATPQIMARLAAGKQVSTSQLLSDAGVQDIENFVAAVRVAQRKARENTEEKGLHTLYMAVGMVTWPANDGGRPHQAPILLYPISASEKSTDGRVAISATGSPQVNPVLLYVLHRDYGIIPSEEILNPAEPGFIDRFRCAISELEGATITAFAVIGNFSFAKMAIVRDLEEYASLIKANNIVAAISGDKEARSQFQQEQTEIELSSIDEIPPDADYSVLDADSSQQAAIVGILEQQNVILNGPPGTGKSQTIANLITNLIANKKSVLFVSAKKAALDVVLHRLRTIDLDYMLMDLTGGSVKTKSMMEALVETMKRARDTPAPEYQEVHDRFFQYRARLNNKDDLTHTVRSPTQMSIYQMEGALLRLPEHVVSSYRFRDDILKSLTPPDITRLSDRLIERDDYAQAVSESASPWSNLSRLSAENIRSVQETVCILHNETIPAMRGCTRELYKGSGYSFRFPADVSEFEDDCQLIDATEKIAAVWKTEVFNETNTQVLRAELDEWKIEGRLAHLWKGWTSHKRHATVATLRSLRRLATGYQDTWPDDIDVAAKIKAQWERLLSSQATDFTLSDEIVASGTAFASAFRKFSSEWAKVAALVGQPNETSVAAIAKLVKELAEDQVTPDRILKLQQIEAEFLSFGLDELLKEFAKVTARDQPLLLRYIWIQSTLDLVAHYEPEIRGFLGSSHNRAVENFCQLDNARLRLARDRVRRIHAQHAVAAMNQYVQQTQLIRQEAAKSRKHRPLRKMCQEAGDAMLAICPCWVTSPLTVSQFIDISMKFDYVIFDESSQVLPEDAVASIVRGRNVVAAGDNKQLPPDIFFSAQDEDDDPETASEAQGYESLLDMMMPFTKSFNLRWHYRSKDEALIAYSNREMYDNSLITFPSPGGIVAVKQEVVKTLPNGEYADSVSAEVSRVIQLAVQHARFYPGKSLGIITMGVKHAQRVQTCLDGEIQKHPELASFFDPNLPERFFVKNLEKVQGDERDRIIISVGYGRDAEGRLPLRFGPILSEGGRRRLNVATTRARERMMIVSSFSHTDINPQRVKPETGLAYLCGFMEFASRNGSFATQLSAGDPLNDFERDILETLRVEGLRISAQLGSADFKIDLAVHHPTVPDRYVLAIECDGATYHSYATARDRDRLRQSRLQANGWRFYRIWSKDWYSRKDEEVDRIMTAYREAVQFSDERVAQENILIKTAPAPSVSSASVVAVVPTDAKPKEPVQPFEKQMSNVDFAVTGNVQQQLTLSPPLPQYGNIQQYPSRDLRRLWRWLKQTRPELMRAKPDEEGELNDEGKNKIKQMEALQMQAMLDEMPWLGTDVTPQKERVLLSAIRRG